MRNIVMRATRRTRVGVLREGKHYSVPNDVANDLDDGSFRFDGDVVETATKEAPEHAARRVGRTRARTTRASKPDTDDAPSATGGDE